MTGAPGGREPAPIATPGGPRSPTGSGSGLQAEGPASAPPRRPQRRRGPTDAGTAPAPARPAAAPRPRRQASLDFTAASRCPPPDAHPAQPRPGGDLSVPPASGSTAGEAAEADDCEDRSERQHGAPDGRTRWPGELVSRTLQLWQPYYDDPLTDEDAREILENAVAFFRVVLRHRVGAPRTKRDRRERVGKDVA